ncbi:stAR-related lipid transfer protein 9-like [Lissotriton helveticus]
MANVKVAVRVRPLSKRETAEGTSIIVEVDGNTAKLRNIKLDGRLEYSGEARKGILEFGFDYCYWSVDSEDPNYASQEVVFQDLGTSVLSGAFKGYNICLFAYGQTGSGKTYTMMGTPASVGLTPRICEGLFARQDDCEGGSTSSSRIEVSFLEIYNERVRDLLKQSERKKPYTLRVREHPEKGPYVQGLSQHAVTDYKQVVELLEQGIANRITAATHVHDASSRSHAIFTIHYTQAILENNLPSEIVSKINLVDLAGSERASPSYCKDRLMEGSNINKSLVTLGIVISALAQNSQMFSSNQSINSIASEGEGSSHSGAASRRLSYIPYRDSILTWLLKDSLGGNSKTIMVATVSPSSTSYNETMSTLRYASNAKNIINKPRVNEDPNVKLIRELRQEIDRLKAMLMTFEMRNSSPSFSDDRDGNLSDLVLQNEQKIEQLTKDWTDKWSDRDTITAEYNVDINKGKAGVTIDSSVPHLITVDDDILSTGVVLYYLREGSTKIGRKDSDQDQDIVLPGQWIERDHCVIENTSGAVTLQPLQGAQCAINGQEVTQPRRLSQGAVVVLGKTHKFRFNHPAEAALLRKRRSNSEASLLSRSSLDWLDLDGDFPSPAALQCSPDLQRSHEDLAESDGAPRTDTRSQDELHVAYQQKLRNLDALYREQVRQQQIYIDDLKQQILAVQIRGERELEQDQALINQQIKENRQSLIQEEEQLLSLQQKRESAAQTDSKTFAEAQVQNTVDTDTGPSVEEHGRKRLVQLELLHRYHIRKAERIISRKRVKFHLEKIVKKQKLLQAKKNLQQLEAACWLSEERLKKISAQSQNSEATSWTSTLLNRSTSSDSVVPQHRSLSSNNLLSSAHSPPFQTYNPWLTITDPPELSTSLHCCHHHAAHPPRKSLSVECLSSTGTKCLSRGIVNFVKIGYSLREKPLTKNQNVGSAGDLENINEDCSCFTYPISLQEHLKMEKAKCRQRQTGAKSKTTNSKDKTVPKPLASGNPARKSRTLGDPGQNSATQVEGKPHSVNNRKERLDPPSHLVTSVKEAKKKVVSAKPPLGRSKQTVNTQKGEVHGPLSSVQRQAETNKEFIAAATSVESINRLSSRVPFQHPNKKWHSTEVLTASVSKATPSFLKKWQEDDESESSDTESFYSVDSLSSAYANALAEKLRREDLERNGRASNQEESGSDDSEMSQDSLTEKRTKSRRDRRKASQKLKAVPVPSSSFVDQGHHGALPAVGPSSGGSGLGKKERSFSVDSLADAEEVPESESSDEMPVELFWKSQSPQLPTLSRRKDHPKPDAFENYAAIESNLGKTSSFYLDLKEDSGSSQSCRSSLVDMEDCLGTSPRIYDKQTKSSFGSPLVLTDAWSSCGSKSENSSPRMTTDSLVGSPDSSLESALHSVAANQKNYEDLKRISPEPFLFHKQPGNGPSLFSTLKPNRIQSSVLSDEQVDGMGTGGCTAAATMVQASKCTFANLEQISTETPHNVLLPSCSTIPNDTALLQMAGVEQELLVVDIVASDEDMHLIEPLLETESHLLDDLTLLTEPFQEEQIPIEEHTLMECKHHLAVIADGHVLPGLNKNNSTTGEASNNQEGRLPSIIDQAHTGNKKLVSHAVEATPTSSIDSLDGNIAQDVCILRIDDNASNIHKCEPSVKKQSEDFILRNCKSEPIEQKICEGVPFETNLPEIDSTPIERLHVNVTQDETPLNTDEERARTCQRESKSGVERDRRDLILKNCSVKSMEGNVFEDASSEKPISVVEKCESSEVALQAGTNVDDGRVSLETDKTVELDLGKKVEERGEQPPERVMESTVCGSTYKSDNTTEILSSCTDCTLPRFDTAEDQERCAPQSPTTRECAAQQRHINKTNQDEQKQLTENLENQYFSLDNGLSTTSVSDRVVSNMCSNMVSDASLEDALPSAICRHNPDLAVPVIADVQLDLPQESECNLSQEAEASEINEPQGLQTEATERNCHVQPTVGTEMNAAKSSGTSFVSACPTHLLNNTSIKQDIPSKDQQFHKPTADTYKGPFPTNDRSLPDAHKEEKAVFSAPTLKPTDCIGELELSKKVKALEKMGSRTVLQSQQLAAQTIQGRESILKEETVLTKDSSLTTNMAQHDRKELNNCAKVINDNTPKDTHQEQEVLPVNPESLIVMHPKKAASQLHILKNQGNNISKKPLINIEQKHRRNSESESETENILLPPKDGGRMNDTEGTIAFSSKLGMHEAMHVEGNGRLFPVNQTLAEGAIALCSQNVSQQAQRANDQGAIVNTGGLSKIPERTFAAAPKKQIPPMTPVENSTIDSLTENTLIKSEATSISAEVDASSRSTNRILDKHSPAFEQNYIRENLCDNRVCTEDKTSSDLVPHREYSDGGIADHAVHAGKQIQNSGLCELDVVTSADKECARLVTDVRLKMPKALSLVSNDNVFHRKVSNGVFNASQNNNKTKIDLNGFNISPGQPDAHAIAAENLHIPHHICDPHLTANTFASADTLALHPVCYPVINNHSEVVLGNTAQSTGHEKVLTGIVVEEVACPCSETVTEKEQFVQASPAAGKDMSKQHNSGCVVQKQDNSSPTSSTKNQLLVGHYSLNNEPKPYISVGSEQCHGNNHQTLVLLSTGSSESMANIVPSEPLQHSLPMGISEARASVNYANVKQPVELPEAVKDGGGVTGIVRTFEDVVHAEGAGVELVEMQTPAKLCVNSPITAHPMFDPMSQLGDCFKDDNDKYTSKLSTVRSPVSLQDQYHIFPPTAQESGPCAEEYASSSIANGGTCKYPVTHPSTPGNAQIENTSEKNPQMNKCKPDLPNLSLSVCPHANYTVTNNSQEITSSVSQDEKKIVVTASNGDDNSTNCVPPLHSHCLCNPPASTPSECSSANEDCEQCDMRNHKGFPSGSTQNVSLVLDTAPQVSKANIYAAQVLQKDDTVDTCINWHPQQRESPMNTLLSFATDTQKQNDMTDSVSKPVTCETPILLASAVICDKDNASSLQEGFTLIKDRHQVSESPKASLQADDLSSHCRDSLGLQQTQTEKMGSAYIEKELHSVEDVSMVASVNDLTCDRRSINHDPLKPASGSPISSANPNLWTLQRDALQLNSQLIPSGNILLYPVLNSCNLAATTHQCSPFDEATAECPDELSLVDSVVKPPKCMQPGKRPMSSPPPTETGLKSIVQNHDAQTFTVGSQEMVTAVGKLINPVDAIITRGMLPSMTYGEKVLLVDREPQKKVLLVDGVGNLILEYLEKDNPELIKLPLMDLDKECVVGYCQNDGVQKPVDSKNTHVDFKNAAQDSPSAKCDHPNSAKEIEQSRMFVRQRCAGGVGNKVGKAFRDSTVDRGGNNGVKQDHKVAKDIEKKNMLKSERLKSSSVSKRNVSSSGDPSSMCLQNESSPVVPNENQLIVDKSQCMKDERRSPHQGHVLSNPAMAATTNTEEAVYYFSRSLHDLSMSVEPPSPTEEEGLINIGKSVMKQDASAQDKSTSFCKQKATQTPHFSFSDKLNSQKCSESNLAEQSPASSIDFEDATMLDRIYQCSNVRPNISECEIAYEAERLAAKPRSEQVEGLSCLQDNKDVMHFGSSDINPYIHPWQQDECLKVGWKQYVFGSASDVSCTQSPQCLDDHKVMRCLSVDNGLNTQRSPFQSHLSSYVNARVISSTLSSIEDSQGWDEEREDFEPTYSSDGVKHYYPLSSEVIITKAEDGVSQFESTSRSPGDSSVPVDEIVLLYPSESESSDKQEKITCEQGTQTLSKARHKKMGKLQQSYAELSKAKTELGQRSFQRPASLTSMQNLSFHLSQLLHDTSELLGNLSQQSPLECDGNNRLYSKPSVRTYLSDSSTQTTSDKSIQTDYPKHAELTDVGSHADQNHDHLNACRSHISLDSTMEDSPCAMDNGTLPLHGDGASQNINFKMQSMPNLSHERCNTNVQATVRTQNPLLRSSTPVLENHPWLPSNGHQQRPLFTSAVSPVASPSPSTEHDMSSNTAVAGSSSVSSAPDFPEYQTLMKKHENIDRKQAYKNALLVDRASSPILTLHASSNTSNSSASVQGSIIPQNSVVKSSFKQRKQGSESPNSRSITDSSMDNCSQTEADSQSSSSQGSKKVFIKAGLSRKKAPVDLLKDNILGKSQSKYRVRCQSNDTSELDSVEYSYSDSSFEFPRHNKRERFNQHVLETAPLEQSFPGKCASEDGINLLLEMEPDVILPDTLLSKKCHQSVGHLWAKSSSVGNFLEFSAGSARTFGFDPARSCTDTGRKSDGVKTSPKCYGAASPRDSSRTHAKSDPVSTSGTSDMTLFLPDDDAASIAASECNTDVLLNESPSIVVSQRPRSYSLRDLPQHNKFSNWSGVQQSPASLVSSSSSVADLQCESMRKRVGLSDGETDGKSHMHTAKAKEIEVLRRERAQVMSGIHLEMNQHPLTVELTEAKLSYGIGETDALLRLLKTNNGETQNSVSIKQQLYERHMKSIEVLRKEREERLQSFRRSRSLSPQKHLSLSQVSLSSQRDLDLPSRRREYLQQLRKDVVDNTRIQEPKKRTNQCPSEIEVLLRDYQRAREEAKTEIARARDKLRERAEQEKRRLHQQMVSSLIKEESKMKTLVSTSTLCTGSSLSLSSGPTSGYNSSNTATYAARKYSTREGKVVPKSMDDSKRGLRGRTSLRNSDVYVLETSSNKRDPEASSTSRNRRGHQTPPKSGSSSPRSIGSIELSFKASPSSPSTSYKDLAKHTLANATAEIMAACSYNLENLFKGQANAGWKYQCTEEEVMVYHKQYPSATRHGFLGAGVIARPLHNVWCAVKDPSNRNLFDKTTTTLRVHKRVSSEIQLVYLVTDMTQCYLKQPRDFCCISTESKEERWFTVAFQSVYDESMPRPSKDIVRGEILPSAWIMQPDTVNGKEVTRVIYSVEVELGAPALPARLLSSVAKQQPLVIASLANFLSS